MESTNAKLSRENQMYATAKKLQFSNVFEGFLKKYDRPGFFSIRWAAVDVVVIAASLIVVYAK